MPPPRRRSRAPLPAYRDWKRTQFGPLAWAAGLPYEHGVVWRDDGQGLRDPSLPGQRGPARKGCQGQRLRQSGRSAGGLAAQPPGIDAVTLEAFPVEPASAP